MCSCALESALAQLARVRAASAEPQALGFTRAPSTLRVRYSRSTRRVKHVPLRPWDHSAVGAGCLLACGASRSRARSSPPRLRCSITARRVKDGPFGGGVLALRGVLTPPPLRAEMAEK